MKNKFLNYAYGGRVVGHKEMPVLAVLKGGEYVLPYGVKPTQKQQKEVAKLKQKRRNGVNALSKYQQNKLKSHSVNHTKKHMDMMKKEMSKGLSFTQAHKKALRVVGK